MIDSSQRRDFLRVTAGGAAALFASPLAAFAQDETQLAATAASDLRRQVTDALVGVDTKIDGTVLYGIHVDAERRFSYEVQEHRQHAFIELKAGEHSGWSEASLGYNKEHETTSFKKRVWRMEWFSKLRGMTVAEALNYVSNQRDKQSYQTLEYAEIALLDLAGKLLGRPATDLLGLTGTAAVPGVYCILSDDPEAVTREAKRAMSQDLTTHLKVKLYGKIETDVAVVRAAREVFGTEAYLIGDVNFGYRRELSDEPIDAIVESMISLRGTGLTGCEDPAAMSINQWEEVQRRVDALDLVPDVPLRPVWKALDQISSQMGRVFNMHPACMGSLIDTVAVGRKIQSWNRRLMVGDASLVGPACPAWQQLAIGLGADWVEAIEKPQEDHVYQDCTTSTAMGRTADGKFTVSNPSPGFGVHLDQTLLKERSYGIVSL